MTEGLARIAPEVATLNAILAGRELGRGRIIVAQSLSYLTHTALFLALLYTFAGRPKPDWGGPVLNVGIWNDPAAARTRGSLPAGQIEAPPARPAAKATEKPQPPAREAVKPAPPPPPQQKVVTPIKDRTPKRPPPRTAPAAVTSVEPQEATASSEGTGSATDDPGPQRGVPGMKTTGPMGTLTAGPLGFGGGGGDGWYVAAVRDIVGSNWSSPFSERRSRPDLLSTTVFFKIRRDGAIIEADIERPSGDSDFDRAALRAVRNSRLPPLPRSFEGSAVGVHYNFDLAR